MKVLKRSISIVLVISLLMSLFAINVSALPPDPGYDKISHHFFAEIGSNIPENVKGSCVYVALTMMLQFYDFYWNDDFVDDSYYTGPRISCSQYDYPDTVPRILLENDSLPDDESEYPDFVRDNYMDYLHLYLLYLASSVVRGDDNQPLINFDDEFYETHSTEARDLLEFYLKNVAGFSEDQVIVHYEYAPGRITTDSDIYESIEEKVNAGIPVFYSAADDNGDGHAMVAYKSENNGSDICLHTGYRENSAIAGDETQTTLSKTTYNNYVEILWLEITDECPHKCSNRYNWYPGTVPVCSCVAYRTMHPAHTHRELGYLVSTTSSTHTYQCSCGYSLVKYHRFTYQSLSNVLHNKSCACGYYTSEQHNFVKQSAQYSVCSDCGYRRDHFGDNENVHLGVEDELEIESD